MKSFNSSPLSKQWLGRNLFKCKKKWNSPGVSQGSKWEGVGSPFIPIQMMQWNVWPSKRVLALCILSPFCFFATTCSLVHNKQQLIVWHGAMNFNRRTQYNKTQGTRSSWLKLFACFFSFGKSLCFYQIISTMCIVDMWGQSGYAISHNHPSWIRSVFVLIMPCRQVIQVFISLSSYCPFPIKFPRCKFFTCILMVWSQLLYRTFPTGWGCFYGAPM